MPLTFHVNDPIPIQRAQLSSLLSIRIDFRASDGHRTNLKEWRHPLVEAIPVRGYNVYRDKP